MSDLVDTTPKLLENTSGAMKPMVPRAPAIDETNTLLDVTEFGQAKISNVWTIILI